MTANFILALCYGVGLFWCGYTYGQLRAYQAIDDELQDLLSRVRHIPDPSEVNSPN